MNFIKPLSLALLFLLISTVSCVTDQELTDDVEALKSELAELIAKIEANNDIAEIVVDGDQLILVFSDGTSLITSVPEAAIPTIGENGNWFVNGEDLGVPAVAEIPIVGANGNWWVGDSDTGVKAAGTDGTNGTNGQDGADGANGQDGQDGADGQNGTDGADGQDGADGVDGTNGIDGIDGVNGLDGNGVESVVYDQTTGILTITLTDGTSVEYVLYFEYELRAVKLEDLNGEYLVSAVKNGDLPFATFEYDANNRLSLITSYATVLNVPVVESTTARTYNGDGTIASQILTQYATKKKAVQDGITLPNREEGILLTYVEAYDELFDGSGIAGYPDTPEDFFTALSTDGVEKNGHIYYADDEELAVRKHMIRGPAATERFGASDIGSGTTYIWTPQYEYSESEEDSVWSETYATRTAYDATVITYSTSLDFGVSGSVDFYPLGQVTEVNTDPSDDTSVPGRIDDYMTRSEDSYETVLSGDWKTLFKSYDIYEEGDVLDTYNIYYAYTGEDFDVSDDDVDNPLDVHVTVVNDQIEMIAVFNDDLGVDEDVLDLVYSGDQLISVIAPQENANEVVSIAYDGQGNPSQILVHPSVLSNGEDGTLDALEAMGLIYSYDEYDSDLGMVVEKQHFPSGGSPFINLTYDYSMKNFMNHTYTAASPFMSIFDLSHAIKGIAWAGHGSALFSEYLDFNDGGYPTKIKTYIQVSASDIPGGTGDFEIDFEIPINGSIATTYQLEYVLKN